MYVACVGRNCRNIAVVIFSSVILLFVSASMSVGMVGDENAA